MPSDAPDPSWTPEAIDAARADIRRIAAERQMSIAHIAREAGVPNGTFSTWLNASYTGRNDRIPNRRSAGSRRWRTATPRAPSRPMRPPSR